MAENWTSYSALTTHRSCPQKWYYGYERRLRKDHPEDVKVELEFGLWWHALRAAHSIERGREAGTLKFVPESLKTVDDGPTIDPEQLWVAQAVHEEAAQWWATLSVSKQETWLERIGWSLPDGLRQTDEEWRKEHADDLEHEQPLGVEVNWRRDLPAMPQRTASGEVEHVDPRTVAVGYVDEIFYDTRRNIVVARDHKTHKVLGTQSAADDMMDSQLQFYSWGATPIVKEWGMGPIRAVAYDRVRMSASKTPKLNLSGTLSASVKDYDLRTYLEWVEAGQEYPGRLKDGSGAGVYEVEESVVARLSTPAWRSAWFQRTLTPLNPNIVKAHLRAAVDTALDVVNTKARSAIAHEAGRNLTSGCRWCDFAGLCRAEMIAGPDAELDLRDFYLVSKK